MEDYEWKSGERPTDLVAHGVLSMCRHSVKGQCAGSVRREPAEYASVVRVARSGGLTVSQES